MTDSVSPRHNPSGPKADPTVNVSWSDMPEDCIHHVISFNPDSVLILPEISRWFKQGCDSFQELYQRNIVAHCSRESLPLYRWIHGGSLPGRNDRAFHLSLPGEIRSHGVRANECPNKILSPKEIDRCNATIMDASLERAWGPLLLRIIMDNPPEARLPGLKAFAHETRLWMIQNTQRLQSITRLDLGGQGLTSVPLEIGLLGNLRELSLNNNSLRAIPYHVFHGMPQLQLLHMNNNHLSVLPSDLFKGLGQLQVLTLNDNWLCTLLPGLFNGLGSLQHLLLQNNRLGALPPDAFHGLGALQHLFLNRNRLTALPPGLFQGLGQLQRLSLADNQLSLLPPDLCHGLPDLGTLFLDGNPQLLVTWQGLPPHRNAIGFLKHIDQFFSYQCQSPLAAFYQLVASSTSSLADVERAFSGLNAIHKSALFGMISDVAGRSRADAQQWGERHLFEDMQTFYVVLKKMVREQLEQLPDNQKQDAREHILRAIDAMQT